MLETERLWLRAFREKDLERFHRWRNDLALMRLDQPGAVRPERLADTEAWLERVLSDEKTIFFALELKESRAFIGAVSLRNLDLKNKNAELAILIDEPEYRGQGLGGEALSALLDYAFGEVGLHRVYLRVLAYNEPAIRLYQRLGFKEEGRLRAQVWREDAWHDVRIFGLLRDEWNARAK